MADQALIYLAGAIDGSPSVLSRGWQGELDIPPGVVLFSPAHAYFGASRGSAPKLDLANRAMIEAADGLLANLSYGQPFGTVREIEYARSMGLPVVYVATVPLDSLCAHDLMWEPDTQRALEELLEQIGNHARWEVSRG